MWQVVQSLVKNCELGIHHGAEGLRISAKGPLAVVGVIILVALLRHTF
jgi:hypothetical protein